MSTPTELFIKYESAFMEVAEELRLDVEKYRHGMANWSFSKAHSKGGQIRIDIQINDHGDVFLLKWWFFGFSDKGWIYKAEEARELNSGISDVVEAIKRAVAAVSQWPIGAWNKEHSPKDVNLVAEIEFCLDKDAQLGSPAWYSGVRPQHRIPGRPDSFFGQIDLLGVETISPGQCCRAKASCVVSEAERSYFVPRFCWHICIRNKIVGYARYVSPFSS